MVGVSPKPLTGPWKAGFALDLHTISSEVVGYDEWGHEVFDTKRSEMGELLYQLKYRKDRTVIRIIAETVVEFSTKQSWGIELVVPVPPSSQRSFQPVLVLAEAITNTLRVPYCGDCVVKVRGTPQLKNIYDLQERSRLLTGAFTASKSAVVGKNVLLFDDLYRSGATLQAVAAALVKDASPRDIYALTLTMTRTRR